MAATVVQSAEGTSTLATVTASFATTPTNGNIIVLCFAADDYNGTPNAGWTQSTGMAIEGGSYHGGYVWWKVASGGSNSFQYTIGSASPSAWVLLEISGLDGSPYDVSNGQNVNASGYQYTTPSITPTAGDRFIVAAFGGSNAAAGDISGDYVNWTNSFTHARSSGNPGTSGARDCIGVGYRSVTANGSTSYSTGVDFPNTVQSRSGMIIAFKVASGGGGQSITGSLFTNANSFYGATVGRGAVNISGALYSDADTFFASTLSKTYTVTGARFDNAALFYAATVAPGTVTISGALFTDGDTFYAATVGRGAVDISGGLYTDPDGFYAATVSQSGAPQTLVGSLFANSQTFYGGNVRTSIALDGSLFTDGDTFYGGTVTTAYVITGSLYTDPDTFFGGTVVQPDAPQILVGELYANDNQFFGGVVVGGRTEQPRQPGGFYPKPVIYVDKHGRPVDLKTYKARAVNEAAQIAKPVIAELPKEERPIAREIVAALRKAVRDKEDGQIATEARRLSALLADADTRLAQILFDLEQAARQQAIDDDELAAILLLAA